MPTFVHDWNSVSPHTVTWWQKCPPAVLPCGSTVSLSLAGCMWLYASRSALIGCHAAAAMAGGPRGTEMWSARLLINTAHGLTFRGQLALTSYVSLICPPALTSTSTSGEGDTSRANRRFQSRTGSPGNRLIWSTAPLTESTITNSSQYV